MRGRIIVSLTGGIMLFLRFFNRLLGFCLFFTGAWVVLPTWIIANMVSGQDNWHFIEGFFHYREIVSLIIVHLGLAIGVLIFISNANKLFKVMPDNTLKRFLSELLNRKCSFEREGNNIPANMLKTRREDVGFFFGAKRKKGVWGLPSTFHFVGKPTNEDGHIVIVGGAGSGKSSCFGIPTLETWSGSIFANDIKGELSSYYKRKWKTTNRPYIIFDPTDKNSKGFDPYYLLRNSTEGELIQNARELALSIIPLPPDIKEPFWIETAQNILTGAILYYFDMGYSFSQTMSDILANPVEDLIEDILNSGTLPAHKFVGQLKKAKSETIASFATTLSNSIMVFATDPLIYDILSKEAADCFLIDNFDINIFLRFPEDKLEQWKPMITLINRQRIRACERRADKFVSNDNVPTLMLLDEFARLGKIEAIEGALATLRSKGVTICLIIQSIAQLDKIYGVPSRRIILDNCQYKAILNVSDPDSQKYFSMLSGSSEVEKKSYSISYDPDSGIEVGNNDTYNMNREPIVYPHEFAKLKDVVLMTPEGFSRVEKEPYYNQTEQPPLTPPTMKLTDFSKVKRVGGMVKGTIDKVQNEARAIINSDNDNAKD